MRNLRNQAAATVITLVATAVLGSGSLISVAQASAETDQSTSDFAIYEGDQPLADVTPGTVLKTRTFSYRLGLIPLPLKVTQILYRTTDMRGRPTANITSILRTPVRSTTDKVIAYGSFYDSLSPQDGPSYGVAGDGRLTSGLVHVEAGLVTPFLLQGYTVVIADTEGPTANFAAGPEYGRTTLDSLRAVLRTPLSGIAENARFGLFGYSGGAIATNWAATLAPSYAPDINARLVGAAEGGILVDPAHNLKYIEGSGVWAGVLAMALVGASRAQDISLEPYLNDYGLKVLAKVRDASIAEVLGAYPGLTWKKMARPEFSEPEKVVEYVRAVNQLNLGLAPSPTIPMFMGQGAGGELEGTLPSKMYGRGDGVMLAGDARSLARQYCADGTQVVYRQYDLTSHFGSALLWAPEAIAWIGARFGNQKVPSTCGQIAPGTSLAALPLPGT